MSTLPGKRKPTARTATGFERDFSYRPEMTKRQQQDLLADAVRNTAAMQPPKESARGRRLRNLD